MRRAWIRSMLEWKRQISLVHFVGVVATMCVVRYPAETLHPHARTARTVQVRCKNICSETKRLQHTRTESTYVLVLRLPGTVVLARILPVRTVTRWVMSLAPSGEKKGRKISFRKEALFSLRQQIITNPLIFFADNRSNSINKYFLKWLIA